MTKVLNPNARAFTQQRGRKIPSPASFHQPDSKLTNDELKPVFELSADDSGDVVVVVYSRPSSQKDLTELNRDVASAVRVWNNKIQPSKKSRPSRFFKTDWHL